VDLSVVGCPTLAIAGELDVLARPETVRAMHAPIKGCRQMILAGVAHSIHWEKPQESAAVIKAFLD
jgi:pimeloyl-ACP methyl ester carboxylesterase